MSKFLNILFAIWLAPKLIRAFLWLLVILGILAIGAFSWTRSILNAIGIDGGNFPLVLWIAGLVIFTIVMVSRSIKNHSKQPSKSNEKSANQIEAETNRETSDYRVRMKQYRNDAERFLESRKKLK